MADVTASPADGSGARRTKSDAQSGFTFDGLQGRVELRARNDSGVAAPMVVQVKAGEPATRVELRLAETYRIAGVVVDASGAPVPGALVGATPVTDVQNQRRFFTATSSPDGRFELLDVPAGTFGLRAGVGHSADGFTFWSLPAKRAQAGDQDVVLTIAATGSLQGTVLFEEGGSPSQYSIHIGGKIATFGDPKFSLEGIPAAAHTLVVTSPEATVRTVDEVMVVAGQERDIGEIKLHRGMTVVGVVVRANGKPAPLAKVVAGKTLLTLSNTVDAALSTPFMGRRQTVADEEGRFRLSGVEEGSVLVAESETGRSDATPLVGAEDVTLVLRETGGIQGKYIWPDGGSGKLAVGASPQAEPSLRFVAAAGLDGTFEFRGLAPGKYLITIATNDEADTQSMESTVVDIQPGTTLPLEVRGAARPANVDVQLEGSPTEHAVIFLVEGRIQPHTAMDIDHEIASRGGGAYRLRMVKFGSHALFKKAAPGLSTACAIPISEDPAQPDFGVKVQLSVTELPVFCAGGTVGPPGNQPTIIRIQLR